MKKTENCVKTIQALNSFLASPKCMETYRSPDHFVRKRLLSFYQIVIYLLYSSKASMFTNISSIITDLQNLDFSSVTKQAVSKARQFINPSLFQDMFLQLYFYCWPVETKCLKMKYRLEMEEFNGTTCTAVIQKFFISILLSNLYSLVKKSLNAKFCVI